MCPSFLPGEMQEQRIVECQRMQSRSLDNLWVSKQIFGLDK